MHVALFLVHAFYPISHRYSYYSYLRCIHKYILQQLKPMYCHLLSKIQSALLPSYLLLKTNTAPDLLMSGHNL